MSTTLQLRLPFLALLLLLGDASFAASEKKLTPPPPPPQPVPQKLKVLRGNAVDISLRIYGLKSQPVYYLIRRAPAGKLSVPKNTELEVAVVQYEPPKDRSIVHDSFEYASKTVEGVSAPSAVEIEIIDGAADLITPAEVVFSPVLDGATDKQTIELENIGGAVTEGDLLIDPPWRVEVTGHYRLEPGQRRTVTLTFAPDKPGEFTGDLRFSSTPDRSTTLRGKAFSAIEARPANLLLETVTGSLTRAGALEVVNHTKESATVRMAENDRLVGDPPLTLTPGQSGTLMVRTKDGDVRPVATEITLEAGTYRTTVPVRGEAIAGVAQAETSQVELRVVPPRPELTATLLVRNYGGQPARAELSCDPEFTLSQDKLDLPIGAEARVEVHLAPGINPPMQGSIDLKSGGVTQRIALLAKARMPLTAPATPHSTASFAATSLPRKSTPKKEEAANENWSPYEQDLEKPIDPVQLIRTVGVTPTSCIIEWHGDRSPAKAFAAEMRELFIGEKGLMQNWHKFPAFRFERTSDNKIRGTFDQLEPGRPYTIRIRELSDSGELGRVVLSSSLTTPVPDTDGQKSRRKMITLVVGVVIVFVVLWRRRRSTVA